MTQTRERNLSKRQQQESVMTRLSECWRGLCTCVASAGLLAVTLPALAQDPRVSLGEPRVAPLAKQNESTRTVTFEFRDQPWDKVMDFLTANFRVPIVTIYKPTGTINFYPPKDKTKFTLAEAFDIINEGLLAHEPSYIMIRKPSSIVIVRADQPQDIDQTYIPRINVEDLEADKPAAERKIGRTELVQVIFPLRTLTPAEAEKEIKTDLSKFGKTAVVSRGTRLMVTDTAENLRRVKKLLSDIDGPGGDNFEVIQLGIVDGASLIKMVEANAGPTGAKPFMQHDLNRNVLIVSGTPQQMTMVKNLARSLGAPGAAANGGGAGVVVPAGPVRYIPLTKSTPGEVIETLMYLWQNLRANPIEYVTQSQLTERLNAPVRPQPPSEPPAEKPKPREMPPAREDQSKAGGRELLLAQGGGQPPDKQGTPSASPGGGGQLTDPANRQAQPRRNLPGRPDKPVFLAPGRGKVLLVASDDPDALVLIQELIDYLMKDDLPGEFRVIPVTNANATDVARLIDEAYNGPRQRGGQGGFNPLQMLMRGGMGGGGGPFGGADFFGGGRGGGGGDRQAPAGPGGTSTTTRISVVADPRTNSLLVRAPTLELENIARLVKEYFDVPENAAPIADTYILTLKFALASEVANVLQQVYRDYVTSSNRGGNNTFQGMVPFQFGGQDQGGGGGGRGGANRVVSLSIGVDTMNNSLIISCPKELFQRIKLVVESMDTSAAGNTKTVVVREIKNLDPLLVQQAMDTINGTRTATGMMGGGLQGGGFTGGGFQGGGFPGGGFQGGGFNRGGGFQGGGFQGGGFQGGGFNRGGFQGGGFQGGGFNRGGGGGFQGGGGRGGGRGFPGGGGAALPTLGPPMALGDSPGGPRFFADRVMEDPKTAKPVVYDPRQNPENSNGIQLAAQEQPPQPQPQPPTGPEAPRAPGTGVQLIPIPGTDRYIIIGSPQEVKALDDLIRQLERVATATDVKVVTLKKSDAQSMQTVLLQLLPQVTAILEPRTNSLVLAGNRNDLQLADLLILRLDAADIRDRVNKVYVLKNTQATQVADTLTEFLGNELALAQRGFAGFGGERAAVVIDEPTTNSLLVNASPAFYPELMKIIEELDQQPAQVVIKVLIAAVQLRNDEEFGVELGLQSPVLFDRSVFPAAGLLGPDGSIGYGTPFMPEGVTVNSSINPAASLAGGGFNFNNLNGLGNNVAVRPGVVGFKGLTNFGTGQTGRGGGPGGFIFSASSNSVNLLIRALKNQGKIEILSRPQVTALDNQVARISVGQSVPVPAGTTISAQGQVFADVEYIDVGVNLDVTPKISPDGTVVMRVVPVVSALTDTTIQVAPGTFAPIIDQILAETTVSAMDGQTVVIGGLIQRTDDKLQRGVPWLSDLPYIGSAFRFRSQMKLKRELLILLEPQIIRSPCDPAGTRILAEETTRMDWYLRNVHEVHGPLGVEPYLPVYPTMPHLPPLPQGAPNGLPTSEMRPTEELPKPQPVLSAPPGVDRR
jgi:type II secretion system protein D